MHEFNKGKNMEFMSAYKRLDNLCKDLLRSDKGVTSYIDEMDNGKYTNLKPYYWNEDYKKLKHYRHIRNQIVHDNYADERTMCDYDDVAWIENFHNRILQGTDPLAQYSKAAQQVQNNNKVRRMQNNTRQSEYRVEYSQRSPQRKKRRVGCIVWMGLFVVCVCVGAWFMMR